MRTSFVELSSGPVHMVDFGGSGPTLVLVHGLGGSVYNWQSLGPLLAEHAKVIAVDLAGFGRTPLNGRRAQVDDNRGLLSEFLHQVAPGKVTLVGNSMGGLIALFQAAVEPNTVERLVLLDPAVPAPRGVTRDRQVVLMFALYALPFVGEWVMRRSARRGPERLVRDTFRMCCVNPDAVAREVYAAHVELARERAEKAPWAHQAYLQAARSLVRILERPKEFVARIQQIRAPALILQGERDRLVPTGASEALSRAHPTWELEVLPGIGHTPMLEAPVDVASRMLRWLGLVEPMSRAR